MIIKFILKIKNIYILTKTKMQAYDFNVYL